MLRERNTLIVRTHKALDICLTAAAFIGAYFIKRDFLPEPFRGLIIAPNYYVILLMIIIIWYVIFELFGLYESYRKQTFGQIFRNMVKAVSTAMLVMFLFMYVIKITDVSRVLIGIFFLLDIGLLGLSKRIVFRTLRRFREKGFNFRNILIVGSRERARDVIDAIGDRLGSGYKVHGCLEVNKDYIGKEIENGIKVVGTLDNLREILLEKVVDEIIYAMPLRKIENPMHYISIAEEIGVPVRIVPDWQIHKLTYRPEIASIRFEDFLGIPTLALSTTSPKHGDLLIKSALDYLLAGIAFAVCLPLLLLIGCAIKFTSKGRIFFTQERCGLNGRKFVLFKFRTMSANAEEKRQEVKALNEADGPVFKIKKDPRITPFVGTLLRKFSLDELPQLINVLKGEMSLVGPRPPTPPEVKQYDIWQRRRLSMKPGLTCLWQIAPKRNEISFKQWMDLDLEYIDKWSLGLDFKIMLKTVWVMVLGTGI
jgi:exopolysaccharide biosynthesis polyprenyl glycosylphosphotransferase